MAEASVSSTSQAASNEPYKMDHANRGYTVLINNRRFKNDLKERIGTHVDLNVMCEFLPQQLGFTDANFDVYHDRTVDQMKDIINEMASKDYSNKDCFVCVILSYGTSKGEVFGIRGEKISLTELFEPLVKGRQEAHRRLAGKPKIVFVQACTDQDTKAAQASTEEAIKASLPEMPDSLFAYSYIPESRSRRDGSWFIQALYDGASGHLMNTDLETILTTSVKEKVIRHQNDRTKLSLPCIKSTLTKKVFFPRK